MSRDVSLLKSGFRGKYLELLARVKDMGHELRPCYTLRDPFEQAILWRRSRSTEQITKAINALNENGAVWLAQVLESVGPQYGNEATQALPGQSWHQWGLAADSFLLVNKEAVWDDEAPGYQVYAAEAKKLELDAGYYWNYKDTCHVQDHTGRVLDEYSWKQIDDAMKQSFGM